MLNETTQKYLLGKRVNYIITLVILIISTVLIIASFCLGFAKALNPVTYEYKEAYNMSVSSFILEVIFITGIASFQYLRTRTGDIKSLIIESFCRVGVIPFCILAFFCATWDINYMLTEYLACGLCIMLAGLVSSLGYWFVVLAVMLGKAIKILCIGFKNAMVGLFNIGYKGKPPIKYSDKVIEVFFQIILIPISALIELCAMYCIFLAHFLGAMLTKSFIYGVLKKFEVDSGFSYYVEPSDREVTTTTSNDIRDVNGNVIGSYDSIQMHVEHDSGYRYESSDDEKLAMVHTFFALPFRIISLILSILALVVPRMYISAMRPKALCNFKLVPFLLLDIIVLK